MMKGRPRSASDKGQRTQSRKDTMGSRKGIKKTDRKSHGRSNHETRPMGIRKTMPKAPNAVFNGTDRAFDLRNMSPCGHDVEKGGPEVFAHASKFRITMDVINGEATSRVQAVDRIKTAFKRSQTTVSYTLHSTEAKIPRNAMEEGQALDKENVDT